MAVRLDVSRTAFPGHSKKENFCNLSYDHESGRNHDQLVKYWFRSRKHDSEEKDIKDIGNGCSPGTGEQSCNGRERGEIPFGNLSNNGGISFDPEAVDTEVLDFEFEEQLPPKKKRKFSSLVLDDRNNKDGMFPKDISVITSDFDPSIDRILEGGPGEVAVSEYRSDGSSLSFERWHQGHQEYEHIEELEEKEEENVQARTISMSRWAMDAESEVLDAKMVSPESGEFRREDSCEGKAIRDTYSESDVDDGAFMENDEVASGGFDSTSQDDDFYQSVGPAASGQRNINMLDGCRSVFEYEYLNKINEGTYGVVHRAKNKMTGNFVALKKVKLGVERDGFPLSSLREINILLSLHHPSIVDVKEVVMDGLDSVFMVMEYMEHDLKGLMEVMKQPFSQSEAKCLLLQLLEGLKYLHDNWVIHRDLKTSNLLLNNKGELKICDFGMSRQYGSQMKPYTPLVVTLWYRAPELLLGTKQYSTAIDLWSVGCIMAEVLSKQPLFNGKSEIDQLDKIFRTLGTPNETIWPGLSKLPGAKVNFVEQPYNLLRKKFPATSFTGSPVLSEAGFDLLNKLLTYDPEKRITAEAALNHQWFREVPLPKSKDFMPTFPARRA